MYWGDAVRVQTPLLGERVENPVRLIEVGNILKKTIMTGQVKNKKVT